MSDWVESPERALYDSRHTPRPKGAPPHWLRCEFFKNGVRCSKGSGHSGPHEEPK